MGHRVEIHRRLQPIVAYRVDGFLDDHQPGTIRHRHEDASSRDGLRYLGRRGSYRHRNIRDCATWRAHERGSDDQRGAHTRRHCRP
jgi:hypothetical protein